MSELFDDPLPVTTSPADPTRPQSLFEQPLPVYFPDGAPGGLSDEDREELNATYAPVSQSTRALNIFTPEQFGAVGDATSDGSATATDDREAINACLAAAGAVNGSVHFRAGGRYRSSGPLAQVDGLVQIEGYGATVYFDRNDHDLLSLGPTGFSDVQRTGGYVRRLILRGASDDDFENSNALAPTNYKAGIVWNSTRYTRTEDCHVNNMDICYDLRGNCYGSKFVRVTTGVTANVGLLLRGQIPGAGMVAGSGSDIQIDGFWGGGAKAAFWCEGGAGGYWFSDCKPGGGHASYTGLRDEYGVWVFGPTYQPATTVVGAVAPDATTITVADATKIVGNELVINGQEIQVLSRAGNVLTVATTATGGWQANYRVKVAIPTGAGVQPTAGLGNVTINDGGIEGTHKVHALRLFRDVTGLIVSGFSFFANNDGAAEDLRKMGNVLKHTGEGAASITFDRCMVQGAWLGAVPIVMSNRWNASNQVEERGTTHGVTPPTFAGTAMSLIDRPMISWSGVPGVASTRDRLFLGTRAVRINNGALEVATNDAGTTWAAPAASVPANALREFPGPVRIQSAPYSIVGTDENGHLSYDNSATAGTYTLPDANAVPTGFTVTVAQTWNGVLTIAVGANSAGIRKPGVGVVSTVSLAGANHTCKFAKGSDGRWIALPYGNALAA